MKSDLDFLVEFDDLEPAAYAEAWLALHEQMESLFGRSVDLVTLATVCNPYFCERALAVRETVYAACGVQVPLGCALGGADRGLRGRKNVC